MRKEIIIDDELLLLKMEENAFEYNLEVIENTLNEVKVLPGIWKLVITDPKNINLAIQYKEFKKGLYKQDYILQLKKDTVYFYHYSPNIHKLLDEGYKCSTNPSVNSVGPGIYGLVNKSELIGNKGFTKLKYTGYYFEFVESHCDNKHKGITKEIFIPYQIFNSNLDKISIVEE